MMLCSVGVLMSDSFKLVIKTRTLSIMNILAFAYVFGCAVVRGNPQLSLLNIVFVSILAVVLIHKLKSNGRLALPKLWQFPALFFVLVMASILFAPHPETAIAYGFTALSAIFGALVIWVALCNGVSYMAIVLGAFAGSIGLVISCLANPINTTEGFRATGTLGNANSVGVYLVFSAFIIVSISAKLRTSKLAIFTALGLILFSIVYTGSRKTLIALLMFAIYLFIRALPVIKLRTVLKIRTVHKRRSVITYSLALLLGICFMILVVPSINVDFISKTFEQIGTIQRFERGLGGSDTSANVRKELLNEAIMLWSQKPLFGHGYGEFASLSSYGLYSHNNYVELLCNTGLVGLFIYYGFHIAILLQIGKPRKNSKLIALFILLLIFAMDTGMVSQVDKYSWLCLIITAYLASRYSEDLENKDAGISNH